MNIYTLIPLVMADIGAVSKDRKNEQQRYSFRGIEDFYLAAHPAFVKHGIFCVPEVIDHASVAFDKANDRGGATTWRHVTIKVRHRFYAPDGSFVDVVTMGEGLDNSDKATNKAMSGAMKYALIELFTVPTQDVEDADRTSPETGRPIVKTPVAVTTAPIPVAPPKVSGPVKQAAAVKTAQGVPSTPPKAAESDDMAAAMADALMRELADKTPPKAEQPPADQLVTVEQAQKIHQRFRETLRDDLKPQSEVMLHDWLGMKLCLDADGNPSAKAIRVNEYAKLGRDAVSWAKHLSEKGVTSAEVS